METGFNRNAPHSYWISAAVMCINFVQSCVQDVYGNVGSILGWEYSHFSVEFKLQGRLYSVDWTVGLVGRGLGMRLD